jgi:putative PEP-CTERM system histidine kinase
MEDFSFYSYLTAAVAYFLLLLLSVAGIKKNTATLPFLIAVISSLAWAAYITLAQYDPSDDLMISDSLGYETLRNAAWFLVLGVLISRQHTNHNYALLYKSGLTYVLAVFVACLMAFELSESLRHHVKQIIGHKIQVRLFSHLVFAIIGLALIEQLYRNAASGLRWVIKFLCIGLGALFTVDFIVYSKSLLFAQLDYPLWSARGLIDALIVPLLAVTMRRLQTSDIAGISLSRHIVFHSTVLMGTGLYLILMSLAGFYIRDFGGHWGEVAEILFIFLAIMLLVILFTSGKIRAHTKVYFNKHFFSYRYDYREEWLKLSETTAKLNSLSELSGAIITTMADLGDSSGGGLWLKDESGGFYLAEAKNLGFSLTQQVPHNHPMIVFLHKNQWVIDYGEYYSHPDHYENVDLSIWAEKKVWLIIPLYLQNDLEAFVVLTQPRAPRALNWEDHDVLKTVGRQLANALALNRASDALSRARQFETYSRISAYLVHDLKNLVAQIALVVKNAEKHKRNPEFIDDAILTLENVVCKMDHLITQLKKGDIARQQETRLNLADIAADVGLQQAGNTPRLQIIKNSTQAIMVMGDKGKITAILGHLVQNAQDATPDDGFVKLELGADSHQAVIKIIDNGCGMDEKFIAERLFKPFDTTKGNAGMGIGVYEARDYVMTHSGNCTVASGLGAGTTFTLTLPLAEPVGHAEQQPEIQAMD